MNDAERRFRAELERHRELALANIVDHLEELERRIEAYVDGRIAEVTRRIDEVHTGALRELTRLQTRR